MPFHVRSELWLSRSDAEWGATRGEDSIRIKLALRRFWEQLSLKIAERCLKRWCFWASRSRLGLVSSDFLGIRPASGRRSRWRLRFHFAPQNGVDIPKNSELRGRQSAGSTIPKTALD